MSRENHGRVHKQINGKDDKEKEDSEDELGYLYHQNLDMENLPPH